MGPRSSSSHSQQQVLRYAALTASCLTLMADHAGWLCVSHQASPFCALHFELHGGITHCKL
jgi:hypothetical protein